MDDQLRTLLAVVDEGSFDAAAYELHISPSAVSQRIKALETRVGQVVVRRGPCTPTRTGTVLVRLARQTALVEAEAMAELGATTASRLAIAVNADSLATWFRPVLAEVAAEPGCLLSLAVEDQDHSARMLRDGEVLAAVTSEATPVGGCRVEPLGSMRYLPLAAPGLLDRHGVDLGSLPTVRFSAKDDLQHAALRAAGVPPRAAPPVHVVPSSQGFVDAVRAGLGWGMVPEPQLGDDLTAGRLVPVAGLQPVDVPLHWQAWRLESARLDAVARAVRRAAADGLRAP